MTEDVVRQAQLLPTFDEADRERLREAVRRLECRHIAVQIADWVTSPLDFVADRLPASTVTTVSNAARKALERCADVAISTLPQTTPGIMNGFHKILAGASGAVGGAFGLFALAAELPVSTTIMLRSVAEIAATSGENMTTPDARLACIDVLALGRGGYWQFRDDLQASRQIAERVIRMEAGRRAAARFLSEYLDKIAARYAGTVLEKVAAQAVPVAGAVGGAAVNVAFLDCFQMVAQGHFTVRQLERKYGTPAVRQQYEEMRKAVACS